MNYEKASYCQHCLHKGRAQKEKRDYVGKVPKRRTPSPHPPSLGIFTFLTVFLLLPFYKPLNWKKNREKYGVGLG